MSHKINISWMFNLKYYSSNTSSVVHSNVNKHCNTSVSGTSVPLANFQAEIYFYIEKPDWEVTISYWFNIYVRIITLHYYWFNIYVRIITLHYPLSVSISMDCVNQLSTRIKKEFPKDLYQI